MDSRAEGSHGATLRHILSLIGHREPSDVRPNAHEWHAAEMRLPPPQPLAVAIRTQCHHCLGQGVVAYARHIVLTSRERVWAYESKPCTHCDTGGWVPGMAIPV